MSVTKEEKQALREDWLKRYWQTFNETVERQAQATTIGEAARTGEKLDDLIWEAYDLTAS